MLGIKNWTVKSASQSISDEAANQINLCDIKQQCAAANKQARASHLCSASEAFPSSPSLQFALVNITLYSSGSQGPEDVA